MTEDDTTGQFVGPSYQGRSLDNADFSAEDLRGADFTGANLRSANFRDAKFGVAPRVGVVLLGLAILASIAAGAAIGWAVTGTFDQLNSDSWDEVAAGGSIGFLIISLVVVIFWRGFDTAIKLVGGLYLIVLVVNIVANLIWEEVEWVAALRATALIVFVILAILVGVLGRVVGGVFGSWSIALVAVLGGLASGRAHGGISGIVIAVSLVLISKRALRGDARDRTIRRMAHRLVGRWGTQFVDADLTGADMTGADTGQCSVKGATLDDVNWDPDEPMPVDMPEDAIPS
jgi:hypothetical protein